MTTILKDRLEKVLRMKLDQNSHESIEKGACIMEAVSYVAGEPWADHPKCACPILTRIAIRLNDAFNDEHRQKLKPLIPLLVGTRADDDTQIARNLYIIWRNITVLYPYLLDLIKAEEFSAKLRSFKNTKEDMAAAAIYLQEIGPKVKKIAYTYAKAYADVYAYANANAYANAKAYAYADANFNAYANANFNAYANANADALREKILAEIADISVETLRLAIEVKK